MTHTYRCETCKDTGVVTLAASSGTTSRPCLCRFGPLPTVADFARKIPIIRLRGDQHCIVELESIRSASPLRIRFNDSQDCWTVETLLRNDGEWVTVTYVPLSGRLREADWIANRLQAFKRRPAVWGSREMLAGQSFMLLEVLAVLQGADPNKVVESAKQVFRKGSMFCVDSYEQVTAFIDQHLTEHQKVAQSVYLVFADDRVLHVCTDMPTAMQYAEDEVARRNVLVEYEFTKVEGPYPSREMLLFYHNSSKPAPVEKIYVWRKEVSV